MNDAETALLRETSAINGLLRPLLHEKGDWAHRMLLVGVHVGVGIIIGLTAGWFF